MPALIGGLKVLFRSPILGPVSTAALLLALSGNGWMNWAQAQSVSVSGDVDPNFSGSVPSWSVGGELRIGWSGTGTVLIENGGSVDSGEGILGRRQGSSGTATVRGAGSSWTNTWLQVGMEGVGTLNIENGGVVHSDRSFVGLFSTGFGTIVVNGTGTRWDSSELYVGYLGIGQLAIQNGSTVSSGTAMIGASEGGKGTVTLNGLGSTWNTNSLVVGSQSTGDLTIANRGALTTDTVSLGQESGISGTVTVRGTGSTWTNDRTFVVGEKGTGILTIADGGTVSTTFGTIAQGGSSSGTATVSGNGSAWNIITPLGVGFDGNGTLLIEDGGHVASSGAFIGARAGSQGLATVTGAGSRWTSPDEFFVGLSGQGHLTVADGGNVSSQIGYLGRFAGSLGTATVSGNTSRWTNTDDLFVGYEGRGDLSVEAGGEVSAGTVSIGQGSTLRVGTGGQAGRLATPVVSNAGALAFDHSDNVSFAGAISGAGTLTKSGLGRLTLTATNTHVGATTVAGGTLMVDGSLASSTIQVQSGATLTGSGSLEGDVTVADGATLSGASGRTLGIGSVALNSAATLKVELSSGSNDPLFDIARGLTLNGYLTVGENSDLSGATSYDLFHYGGMLTSAPLVITSAPIGYKRSNFVLDTSSGKVTLNLIDAMGQQYWSQGSGLWTSSGWSNPNGSLLTQWEGDTAVFRGGGGTVTVGSTQNFSALRFEADGFRIVPGAGGALTIAGARGDVRVESGRTATIATPISGTGQLAKGGAGTLILSGVNTYQGGTWLAAGTLGIGSDDNLGHASGRLAIEAGATLRALEDLGSGRGITLGLGGGILDTDAHTVTFSGAIDGVGSLTKLGTGTLNLSGQNTYKGGTAVSAGTLIGTAASFGSGLITNNAALVLDQATDATLANAIAGTGRLTKSGSGHLDLTGISTLSGPTYVEAGHLAVNGSLTASPVTVAGGTLGGSGTIAGLAVQSGGTVAPGNSIGTLSVNGNVSFAPGSVFAVEINGAGQSDRLAATGTATLSGGTVMILPDQGINFLENSPYTIVTAQGGVSGQFAGTQSTEFAFISPTLGYATNAVTLTMVRKTDPNPPPPTTPTPPLPPTPLAFHSVAVTKNQYRTADAIEALRPGHRLYNTVLGASVAGARQAFDALSGEAHASAASVAYGDAAQVQNSILTRLRQPLTSRLPTFVQDSYTAAYAADAPGATLQPVAVVPAFDPRRFALWGEGFGSWGKIGGNGNAAGLDSSTGGFILGADAQVAEAFRLGLAGGFTRTTFDIDGRLSSGSNETVFGALYGSGSWGNVTLRVGASYAGHDIDAQRQVQFPGFSDQVRASYDGWTAQAFGEVGYRMGLGPVQLEPFVGASVLRLHTDAFQEEGGPAALTGSARDQDLATTTLGVRAEARLSDTVPLIVRGLIGWRHAYGDVEPEALLAFSGGASAFAVAGTPIDRNALVAEAGLDWQITPDMTLGAAYVGQIGERAQEHALKGNFIWRF
ncbi:autotransporter domain-containing protein [Microvirga lotononidis]|uniref:autotransporter domain-containing protein n=1 Tax=Microvirga lotononidis TaxID=864069 RepID=UPI002AF6A6E3|nr:autotransporter domain-containing protein [Microvirga lotononidis]WQO31042.1 autotransporter domain-containing protein [Microvirga lotononidis]